MLNLDIAGEFLVMAATLAQIKSLMLLPPDPSAQEEEEEEEDPREELVRRLLEYQRYKEVAEEFRDRPILDRDVFGRGAVPKERPESSSPFSEVSVFKLIEALDRVMRSASRRISHEVLVERISIAERIQELAEALFEKKEATFEELFEKDSTKMMVIVTFMALLEMARLRMVRLHQAEGSEVIYVRCLLERVEDVDQALVAGDIED